MKNKTLSWLSAFVLLIPSAFAAETFLDTLYQIFGSIANINLGDTSGQGLFFAKLLLFIIVFALVYFALAMSIFQEREQKNFAIWVAVAVSVGVVLIIPSAFIRQIFQTYAVIAIVALIGGPLLGMFMLSSILKEKLSNHPRTAHIIDAVLYYLVVVSMRAVNEGLLKREYNILLYDQWFSFAFAIAEILMFYHIIAIFFAGGKESIAAFDVGKFPGQAKEAAETYTPTFARMAKRMLRKGFKEETQVVADLADAKAALIARPPDLIEVVNKLGMANERAKNMLAIDKFIKDLQNRADQIADAAEKVNQRRKIDALANIMIRDVPVMQREISAMGAALAPMVMQIQAAGPAGFQALATKVPGKAAQFKKFVSDWSRKLDDLIRMGQRLEDAILNIKILDQELEQTFQV